MLRKGCNWVVSLHKVFVFSHTQIVIFLMKPLICLRCNPTAFGDKFIQKHLVYMVNRELGMSHWMTLFTNPVSPWEKGSFAYAKTKTQISCAVTAQLISAFVFAKQIVQLLLYLYPKFQASRLLLWLYRSVCIRTQSEPSKSGAQIMPQSI